MNQLAGGLHRVAAWQCRPVPGDVAGNLARLDAACADAAARGAQLLVTPEMFSCGYGLTARAAASFAQPPGGAVEAAVAQLARRHQVAVCFGHPEARPGGQPYNAATLIGADGAVRGRHRKVHLFGQADRELFTPGEAAPQAFDFDGTPVGMLICYDVEFPEAVRALAAGGARMVAVPTANMAGFDDVQQVLVRARAMENGCTVAYANYCGADDVFTYNGASVICGPGGQVLAQASASEEELLVADLPPGPGPSAAPYLADRRPGLYGTG